VDECKPLALERRRRKAQYLDVGADTARDLAALALFGAPLH